ncbi:Hypothetical predicted protein [Octopus vulgaris]|uniref:Uncharacterized protein n=1 Tax=Octopus vulgaris TaxID=6645 RepID=A0AA36APD1_OCTVU|nr:Hypothetical predicted protein [Octopus vulgaris]
MDKFEEFYSRVLDGFTEPPEKRSRHEEPKSLRTLFHNVLDEIIVHVEQRLKTMEEFKFMELLNPKLFHTYEKQFPMETFSFLNIYKNILELDGMKCELKSVYAADFAKQASSIQEVANIIQELELNQALTEVIKLLRLILTSRLLCGLSFEIIFIREKKKKKRKKKRRKMAKANICYWRQNEFGS